MNRLRIDGQRIILRDWQRHDLDAYAYWMRPEHRWQSLDGPYYPKASMADIPRLVDRLRERIVLDQSPEPCIQLAIADRESDALRGQVSWY